MKFCK